MVLPCRGVSIFSKLSNYTANFMNCFTEYLINNIFLACLYSFQFLWWWGFKILQWNSTQFFDRFDILCEISVGPVVCTRRPLAKVLTIYCEDKHVLILLCFIRFIDLVAQRKHGGRACKTQRKKTWRVPGSKSKSRYWAISSERKTIRNQEQGSYCFTT